jgi:hypothetical protein
MLRGIAECAFAGHLASSVSSFNRMREETLSETLSFRNRLAESHMRVAREQEDTPEASRRAKKDATGAEGT